MPLPYENNKDCGISILLLLLPYVKTEPPVPKRPASLSPFSSHATIYK
jgi:hypothetical protein